ncbi:MAG: Rpn family recombination-promoting nuclease/putative transposase [Magnetococcales bacterium]|nr:Rpn family recombination-promoting nuclease/putative transposase [Magnetococcales bacterium]
MTELVQPHDRLFKVLMSHPETAGALLREHLPGEIVALLAPGDPEWVPGSFIGNALRPFYSDLILKARTVSGGDLHFYLLIEHKSHFDRKVAWQLDRGRHRFLEQKDRDDPNWVTLPAIVPVVLYHGAREWTMPNEFLALVDADEALRPWLMNFAFPVINLGAIPDERLSAHARLKAGLMALKYGTRDAATQMAVLEEIVKAVWEVPELFEPVMLYLIHTFSTLRTDQVRKIVVRVQPKEENQMMSLFAREILEKNKDVFVQEGKAELLLRMLQMRFGVLPESIRSQVTSAGSNDIDAWSDRLFQADSLQAVFR